jgi:tetratricopeptide (TPR) repeat protein
MPRHRVFRATFPALWLLASCAGAGGALEQSRLHAIEGNYFLAYRVLEGARDPADPDPALEKAYWQARLDFLIDQGRQRIFHDREVEAMISLNQALAQDPGNEVVLALIARVNAKLADRAVHRGDLHLRQDELSQALLAYTEAQRHVPGYGPAVLGVEAVRVAFGKMHAKAQEHFLEAVRKYPELRMVEVDWHANAALANDPSLDIARDLQGKAQRVLGQKAFARARASEEKGAYGAALMEYREARQLDPHMTGIDARIAHMEQEVKAASLIERAYMQVLHEKFDQARDMLSQAFELTVLEKPRVSELLLQARRQESMLRYREAKDLELQGRKQEALEAFRALSAEWPEGLEDEKVRIYNLETDLDLAQKAYAAGLAAEERGEWLQAAEHHATALSYCAGYLDARERLVKARAQLQ